MRERTSSELTAGVRPSGRERGLGQDMGTRGGGEVPTGLCFHPLLHWLCQKPLGFTLPFDSELPPGQELVSAVAVPELKSTDVDKWEILGQWPGERGWQAKQWQG